MNTEFLKRDFTKVPRGLVWRLSHDKVLTGNDLRVLMAIIGFSYGWNKEETAIRNKQLVEATGIRASHICEHLERLESANYIVRIGSIIRVLPLAPATPSVHAMVISLPAKEEIEACACSQPTDNLPF